MNLYTSFDSQIVSFEPAINWSSYTFSYTALVNFVYEFQPLLQASLLSFLSFGSSLKSCDNRASEFLRSIGKHLKEIAVEILCRCDHLQFAWRSCHNIFPCFKGPRLRLGLARTMMAEQAQLIFILKAGRTPTLPLLTP